MNTPIEHPRTTNRNTLIVVLLATTTLLANFGCSRAPDWVRSFDAVGSYTVYEGLPHPLREADLLKRERVRTDTTMIAGHPFYTPPLVVDGTPADRIRNLLGDSDRYTPPGLPKDCGPFHPDFAVEWSDGGPAQQLLICFTCTEALVVSVRGERTYGLRGVPEVRDLLQSLARKRPRE